MPGAAAAGWARGVLRGPGSGVARAVLAAENAVAVSRSPLVLECSCSWWRGGPSPAGRGGLMCLPFPLQQPGHRPHPSQALPPEYEQIPRFAELRLSLRDVQRAEAGAPDLPVNRQGQGRRRPQEQDQPSGLRPQAPARPARGRPGPDSAVPTAARTPGSSLPLQSSARHPL